MFKWIWLIIIGIGWLIWTFWAIVELVMGIKDKDLSWYFYQMTPLSAWVYTHIFVLFISSFTSFINFVAER